METPLVEEFVTRRTFPCRYCYGDGKRQLTPQKYAEAVDAHKLKRAKNLASEKVDIGDFPYSETYFDHRKPPNHDCPKCKGAGDKVTSLKDTRTLSPRAMAAFAGVKIVDGRAVAMFYEDGLLNEVTES